MTEVLVALPQQTVVMTILFQVLNLYIFAVCASLRAAAPDLHKRGIPVVRQRCAVIFIGMCVCALSAHFHNRVIFYLTQTPKKCIS